MTTSPLTVSAKSSLGSAVGWGAFLACSWTWCIGMFLPVLLVRDYGIWGWIVFAVPNVVGAAAMGMIPRDDRSLRNLLIQHPAATRLFSLVTIAFHLFFNAWIIRRLLPGYGPSLTIALAMLIYFAIAPTTRRDLVLAVAVFAVSILAMLILGFMGILSAPVPLNPPGTGGALRSLAGVCVFGFLLCPYLDLTFHRVRQAAGTRLAPSAFLIGFGVLFLAIILFSLRYAIFLSPVIGNPDALKSARMAAIILGLYMSLQSAFTIAVHARELIGGLVPANRGRSIAIAVAVFLIPVILGIVSQEPYGLFGLTCGEVFYRCFMSFYGLYFPAYVYLCIIPRRASFLTFAVAVLLATPLFFAAFILNHMLLLFPALAIILLAKLLPNSSASSLTAVPL